MNTDLFFKGLVYSLDFIEKVCGIPNLPEAQVELMAIAGQESNWQYRRQLGGPARSYFQGEKTGGMILAVHHAATHDMAVALFQVLDISEPTSEWSMPTDDTIYEAMAWNPLLQVGLARFLLYTDPRALPKVGAEQEAYHYYDSIWRPGAKRPQDWPRVYKIAMDYVMSIKAIRSLSKSTPRSTTDGHQE